jgi:hypothetical protein
LPVSGALEQESVMNALMNMMNECFISIFIFRYS